MSTFVMVDGDNIQLDVFINEIKPQIEYKYGKKFKINVYCQSNLIVRYQSMRELTLSINCSKTKNKKFCNMKCFYVDKKKQTETSIEKGKKVTNDTFKSYLINKNGHKCQMCSFSEWGDKPILLILDHVNGNSDDCSLENLRLICSNCDTLTPTYKGRNKGNGRFSRRQRYQEGKSF